MKGPDEEYLRQRRWELDDRCDGHLSLRDEPQEMGYVSQLFLPYRRNKITYLFDHAALATILLVLRLLLGLRAYPTIDP